MFCVTREIDFCYGHRLLNYDGKCKHLHGHNGRAVITIAAETLDGRGMVVDFKDVKMVVAGWIDDNLDHRMILHKDDPVVETLQGMQEPLFLVDENPTAENIARIIYEVAKSHGFPIIKTELWETPHCFATYSEWFESYCSAGLSPLDAIYLQAESIQGLSCATAGLKLIGKSPLKRYDSDLKHEFCLGKSTNKM